MLAEHGRECLERLAPPPRSSGMEDMAEGYLWMAEESRLKPVHRIARINLDLLKRLEAQREALVANTRLRTRPPGQQCTALGRTGHGQILAGEGVHALVNRERPAGAASIGLVEVQREDRTAQAGAGMVHATRLAFGAHRMAVHPEPFRRLQELKLRRRSTSKKTGGIAHCDATRSFDRR